MEVLQRLGMFEQSLHVTEVRQQSLVSNYPAVLALHIREYHLYRALDVINGLTDGSLHLLVFIVEHSSPLVRVWKISMI